MKVKPMKVLMIEDNPGDARLFQETLFEGDKDPFDLECVERLSTGLDRLSQGGVDLTIVDLSLPDSKGLDTLNKVKIKAPDTPVVVLTGLDDESLAIKAVQNGAQDYLVKGQLNADLLTRYLRYAIERHKLFEVNKQQTQKLLASEANLRNVIITNADGMIVLDKSGVIHYVNPAAEDLFGCDSEELIGQIFGYPVVYGDKTELEIKRNNGEDIIVEMRVVQTKWESKKAYLATLRDITDRYRLEEELREHRDNLEELVEKRTIELKTINKQLKEEIFERKRAEKDLRIAMKQAEAASNAKSEFLKNMSHEIRTPLNGILGLTEILLDSSLSQGQLQYQTMVKNSAKQLLGILNDMLDLSKIEAGQLELEAMDFTLRSIVEDVSDIFIHEVEKKALELNIFVHSNVPNYLYGDSGRLRQILFNLVGNAVKFTNTGDILIKAELDKKEAGRALIKFSVYDTGIGVPCEHQKNIFESFTQADSSSTREFGGAGLGLTITKQLVEKMGGEIWLQSPAPDYEIRHSHFNKEETGGGSVFHFTAQFQIQKQQQQERLVLPADIQGIKVLAADDNVISRFVLNEILQSFGSRPEIVNSGAEALKMLRENDDFQLVFLDYSMPEMNGIELITKIRNLKKFKNLPCILLTSDGYNKDLTRIDKLSGVWILTKPVKQNILFDTIIKAMGVSPRGHAHELESNIKKDEYLSKLSLLKDFAFILLTEDNLINQKVAASLIKKTGIPVDVANDGLEALDLLSRKKYDLIFMDVQMPNMDGLTATKNIREDLKLTELPIIAMTAHAMKGDKEKCLNAGMDDYISKPVEPDKLYKVIYDWLVPK